MRGITNPLKLEEIHSSGYPSISHDDNPVNYLCSLPGITVISISGSNKNE
jgi:hypothetical protein